MDLLCDADEYKLINNHIDVVYFNGDTPLEKKQTKQLIENNVRLQLQSNKGRFQ